MKCDMSKVRLITVEPALFLFMFAGGLTWPTMKAIIYRKVCLSHFNATLCDNVDNGNFTEEENIVQSDSSHWYLAETFCFDIPSIVTSFFYGVISDHFSRKMALLLPIVGQVLSGINYLLNTIYMDWHVGFVLIGPLCSGLCGGWVVCCLSAFSLISEVTSVESRTTRIAIGESMISISIALAQFCGGVLMDKTSAVFVLSFAVALYSLAVFYVIVAIKDEPRKEQTTPVDGKKEAVFSAGRVKGAITVVFRKREGGRRTNILTLLGIMILLHFATQPTWSLAYLYVRRYPLSWTQTTYGYYLGYTLGLRGICLLAILPLLKYTLHMHETAIMFLSLVLTAISEFLFGFTTTTWMVFAVASIAFLSDTSYTCMRSLLSSLVDKNEVGQMFAVFGSLQSASGLVANAVYNTAYPLTLTVWAGLCFVVGASISIIPLSVIGWLHRRMKNEPPSYSPLANEEDELAESIECLTRLNSGSEDEEMVDVLS